VSDNCEACGTPMRRQRNHPTTRFCSRSCANVGRRRPSLEERFRARIDVRGAAECWPWTGPLSRGYGRMKWTDGAQHGAHRIAYALAYGWPAPDILICHTCDQASCCNPAHLWVGTALDNNRDRAAKGRSCTGSRHHSYRLTDDQVREIRAVRGETLLSIATRYSVATTTVHGIRRGTKRMGVGV
jgi:hypothetical protein